MKLSSQQFADLVGVSKKTVQNYREQGMPSVKDKSYYKYDFESIKWLFENGIKELNSPINMEKETPPPKHRKDLADAQLKEYRLGILEKKYILADEVREDYFNIARTTRDSFLNLKRIAPKLVNKNLYEIGEIMDKEVYKILDSLVNEKFK